MAGMEIVREGAEPLDSLQVSKVARHLFDAHCEELRELNDINAYVNGKRLDIYVPRSASQEYLTLVRQSKYNVLPIVLSGLAQALYCDGFRKTGEEDLSPLWGDFWQPNRMDARQTGIYRPAIKYGWAYATVLPSDLPWQVNPPVPPLRATARPDQVMTPYSPRRCIAMYEDVANDEWPLYAMLFERPYDEAGDTKTPAILLDQVAAYRVIVGKGSVEHVDTALLTAGDGNPLGVCPVIRYPDSYDDPDNGPQGKIRGIIPVQDQIDQTTYSLLMAQHYAAFIQKWATGLALEEDENGVLKKPFEPGVDTILTNESVDARFGNFDPTSLTGYLDSRNNAVLFIASATQTPPQNLLLGGGISNISAETLTALESGHRMDISEHQLIFGESHEQAFRLASLYRGNETGWNDTSSEVVWRDTTPRSLAQIADALGKMAVQLGVPKRALWEMIPGVTDQMIKRWETMRLGEAAESMLNSLDEGDEDAITSGEPVDGGPAATVGATGTGGQGQA